MDRSESVFEKEFTEALFTHLAPVENNIQANVRNNGRPLFHYTSVEGLKGIIESQELWATNLAYMNDTREMHTGSAVIQEILAADIDHATDQQTKKLLQALQEYSGKSPIKNAHAVCFSKNGDQLSQWRGYGSNGKGYAIGFDPSALESDLTEGFLLSGCLYHKPQQEEGIRKHINMSLEFTSRYISNNDLKPDGKVFWIIVRGLLVVLDHMLVSVKHAAFVEEEEIRLHNSAAIADPNSVRFRTSNGMLIPYIPVRPSSGKRLPIRKIIVGPNSRVDRAIAALKLYLASTGYQDIAVEKSTIPYQD